jgi:hypothetical protein
MQQVTKKMPNKKKTNKNKVMWLLVTMAKKKHIVITTRRLERQDWKKNDHCRVTIGSSLVNFASNCQ